MSLADAGSVPPLTPLVSPCLFCGHPGGVSVCLGLYHGGHEKTEARGQVVCCIIIYALLRKKHCLCTIALRIFYEQL